MFLFKKILTLFVRKDCCEPGFATAQTVYLFFQTAAVVISQEGHPEQQLLKRLAGAPKQRSAEHFQAGCRAFPRD